MFFDPFWGYILRPLKIGFQSHGYEELFLIYFEKAFFFSLFFHSICASYFWEGKLQILTKSNQLVCLFSAFCLGPVEKRFSAWTLSSSIFMVSPFAWAERSLCGAKRETLSSLNHGREESTPEKLGTAV